MIYSTGYITIITNVSSKQKTKYKRKTLTLEMLGEEQLEEALKIKYAFTAFLPKSYECRFLEDYTGKIKPFIEKQIKERIVSLQVTHLNYVSEQVMQSMKKNRRRK